MALRFLWDSRKAASNERKHGIGFQEATTVFDDSLSVTIPDPDYSADEERFLLLGLSNCRRLLVVAHSEHGDSPHHQRAAGKPPGEHMKKRRSEVSDRLIGTRYGLTMTFAAG